MAAVSGKKREIKSFEKQVGVFEATVVAINPNREELEKLLGIPDLKDDPTYLKEDEKDGLQKLNVTIWLKEIMNGQLFNVRFYLKDKYRTNKDESKNQYINTAGNTGWADEEANLPAWILKDGRDVRQAHIGEEELYNFCRSWLSQLDTRDPDTILQFDWKKLMKGNVKELTDLIGESDAEDNFTGTVVALATIRTADNAEGEATDYQQVYNRNFLPGYTMKFFKLAGKKAPKMVDKFIESVEDPEYGCKEFYGLELRPLHLYNPEENIARDDRSDISEDGPDL